MAAGSVKLSCVRIKKPDLATIDRLARIQLAVRRGGQELQLADAGCDLMALIDLAGLAGVLRVEVRRQPEQRE